MRYAIRWFKCKLKPPKNGVTQYFALKDKILTLMDNLYWVLSFGKESCTTKWRLLYSYVFSETILSNIYRIYNEKYWFWVFYH